MDGRGGNQPVGFFEKAASLDEKKDAKGAVVDPVADPDKFWKAKI